MRRYCKIGCMICMVAFLLVALVSSSPAQMNVFKIGSIGPLSGPGAGWGLGQSRAMKYVIDNWNKKGGLLVQGKRHKIEMVDYDNKYLTTETVSAVNKAVFGDKAKYIWVVGGANVLASISITEPNGVFLLASCAGMEQVTNPKNPLTFRFMPNCDAIGPTLYYEELIKQFGVKNIALVGPDDDTGYMAIDTCKKIINKKNLPLKVVANEFFTRGSMDFMPTIVRILNRNPDLIDMTVSSPGDAGLLLKQLGESGYAGLRMNSVSIQTPSVLWATAKDFAKGTFMVSVFAEPPTPEYAQLTERYLRDYGGTSVGATAYYTYDGTNLLFEVIEKVGTFDTTIVANAMASMKWNSIYGPARWAGKEEILGFGIDRTLTVPIPMSKIGEGGRVEKWMLKNLPFQK